MSRNLCKTICYYCGTYPVLLEEPRPIRRKNCGIYFDEFKGMIVADAECPLCKAQYLAWIDERPRGKQNNVNIRRPDLPWKAHLSYHSRPAYYTRYTDPHSGETHHDLSFRASFNDEPALEDLPLFKIEKVRGGKYEHDGYGAERWPDVWSRRVNKEIGRDPNHLPTGLEIEEL